jgi:hypothetical protein
MASPAEGASHLLSPGALEPLAKPQRAPQHTYAAPILLAGSAKCPVRVSVCRRRTLSTRRDPHRLQVLPAVCTRGLCYSGTLRNVICAGGSLRRNSKRAASNLEPGLPGLRQSLLDVRGGKPCELTAHIYMRQHTVLRTSWYLSAASEEGIHACSSTGSMYSVHQLCRGKGVLRGCIRACTCLTGRVGTCSNSFEASSTHFVLRTLLAFRASSADPSDLALHRLSVLSRLLVFPGPRLCVSLICSVSV